MITSNFEIVRLEKYNNTIYIQLNIDNNLIEIPLIDIILKLENMKGIV